MEPPCVGMGHHSARPGEAQHEFGSGGGVRCSVSLRIEATQSLALHIASPLNDQAIDRRGGVGGPEAVVDIHHRDAAAAAVEHA
jgi:hypothetical protein